MTLALVPDAASVPAHLGATGDLPYALTGAP